MSAPNAINADVDHVRSSAPRLANWANVTVISFSFLKGAWQAIINAPISTEAAREVFNDYWNACGHMTVVRICALLDRDERVISYQSVYRCLERDEITDALVRRLCDDPPFHVEDDVRRSINHFLRVYRAIDWKLHGRLINLRNFGIAHLCSGRSMGEITLDELGNIVRVVKDLAECLSPFRTDVPFVHEDEIADRVKRATMMWRASFREGNK